MEVNPRENNVNLRAHRKTKKIHGKDARKDAKKNNNIHLSQRREGRMLTNLTYLVRRATRIDTLS